MNLTFITIDIKSKPKSNPFKLFYQSTHNLLLK